MDYTYQIRLRRGSSVQWELSNPILLDGEPGYDTTTNYYKIGDGIRHWLELPWTTGVKGDSASVDSGVATVGTPGAPPEVRNVGTKQNAVFDFVIPQGLPGKDLIVHEGPAQDQPSEWLPKELLWDPDGELTGDFPITEKEADARYVLRSEIDEMIRTAIANQ